MKVHFIHLKNFPKTELARRKLTSHMFPHAENDYTNMVWDLPLVKGAFSPNGTLLSYWSKYQAPSEKDALKLRQTLRSLKHMG